ncbi:MAG: hypothetical protein O2V44_05730 [Candidatus Bathyarchaeota archaeon]|nr:hypothetical protein [Candidatus Bathyarchaeota archaeon]
MFPNLTPVHLILIFLILALGAFLTLLLLPSLLELRKPKDSGPRKIAEATTEDEKNS